MHIKNMKIMREFKLIKEKKNEYIKISINMKKNLKKNYLKENYQVKN